jgi:hypothetical protein
MRVFIFGDNHSILDPDIFMYIEQMELMAFFAGYPLVFAIVRFLADEFRNSRVGWIRKLPALLPYAYAFTATLYAGMVLNSMYPHYSAGLLREQFSAHYLRIWGVFAVLFWIPAFSKKPIFSVLHSLVFFFFLLKDVFMHISTTADGRISNDMKIYSISLLLNAVTLGVTAVAYFILDRIRKHRNRHLQ